MEKFIFNLLKEPSEEEIENGRKFFAGQNTFFKGVVNTSGLPQPDRLEVCFSGRSNVGKSSLINAVTDRKNLARTSNTPGRTQEINYFSIENKIYLVDLPGYGFAEAPLSVVKQWQDLLKSYLSGRQTLRRVFVLVDSRRGIKAVDQEILKLLDKAAVNFQIVLTKVDKIKDAEFDSILKSLSDILSSHPAAFPEIIATSVNSGLGISKLKSVIASLH
tara:strand:- start:577 stop:1230 length:654 start_codon:yes stop_codon:yes gene_type:complete